MLSFYNNKCSEVENSTTHLESVPDISFARIRLLDFVKLHDFYKRCPDYFISIASPLPSFNEVYQELKASVSASKVRYSFITLSRKNKHEPLKYNSSPEIVGLLVETLEYQLPDTKTINLLLLIPTIQNLEIGGKILEILETKYKESVKKILVNTYGNDPWTKHLLEKNGYEQILGNSVSNTQYYRNL